VGQAQSTSMISYDSNIDGKWNDGSAKTVTTFDDRFPKPFVNGKGFEMHASGNPVLKLDGHGVGTLEADPGHGRVYIDSVNYKAVTEYELRFNDENIDNHTCQTQSRHQQGGDGPNRFGGISHMIDRKGKKCGSKLEKFHNEHISGPEVSLPKPIDIGQWVKVRLTDIPNQTDKSIQSKMEINFDGSGFVKCVEHKYTGLEPYMVDEAKFRESSYTWFRVNNDQKGSISVRNIKQTAL
jgi:hypothetical protein